MATLLYVLLVPEARRSLVIVEDFGGKVAAQQLSRTCVARLLIAAAGRLRRQEPGPPTALRRRRTIARAHWPL